MDKVRLKQPVVAAGGQAVLQPGEYPRSELAHCNMNWLIQSGAAELVNGNQVVSLLPDNPTEQDYQEEVLRLQIALEETLAELDKAKNTPAPVKSFPGGVKTGMTLDEAKRASGEGLAADSAARKLRDAEARADSMEKQANKLDKDLARVTQERDKAINRVAELETELKEEQATKPGK